MLGAYYALHYGSEWLEWSMRSVVNFVDAIFVFYTSVPSYGYTGNVPKPENESKDVLQFIANKFDAIWEDVPRNIATNEINHRKYALDYMKTCGCDRILVADADELHDPLVLQKQLVYTLQYPEQMHFGVNMWNFWRSLKWVCTDEFYPTRIINLKGDPHKMLMHIPDSLGRVYHMGYAQSSELVKYKMSIHGHKAEIRPNWFEDKFLMWTPFVRDVHPVAIGLWNPMLYPKDDALDFLTNDHAYYGKDLIE